MPSEGSPDQDEQKGIGKKERGKGECGTLTRKKEQELEGGHCMSEEKGGRSQRVLKGKEDLWQLKKNGCMKVHKRNRRGIM